MHTNERQPVFRLPYQDFPRLYRRARQGQKLGQFEVVGLLAVDPGKPRVLRLVFLQNRAVVPCKWTLLKRDIANSSQGLQANGLRTVGLFHSHPLSYAKLGPHDRRSTPVGWCHLVYDVCALEPRLYIVRRQNGRREIEEIPLTVERSSRIERRG